MKKLGKTYEPVTYEGAGHGFMRAGEDPADNRPANKKAHDEAWKRWTGCAEKALIPDDPRASFSPAQEKRRPFSGVRPLGRSNVRKDRDREEFQTVADVRGLLRLGQPRSGRPPHAH